MNMNYMISIYDRVRGDWQCKGNDKMLLKHSGHIDDDQCMESGDDSSLSP